MYLHWAYTWPCLHTPLKSWAHWWPTNSQTHRGYLLTDRSTQTTHCYHTPQPAQFQPLDFTSVSVIKYHLTVLFTSWIQQRWPRNKKCMQSFEFKSQRIYWDIGVSHWSCGAVRSKSRSRHQHPSNILYYHTNLQFQAVTKPSSERPKFNSKLEALNCKEWKADA